MRSAQLWSDSILQTLDDAIHSVALTSKGEAKVDIVTVPNLSEHLSNAATKARFGLCGAHEVAEQPAAAGRRRDLDPSEVDFAWRGDAKAIV